MAPKNNKSVKKTKKTGIDGISKCFDNNYSEKKSKKSSDFSLQRLEDLDEWIRLWNYLALRDEYVCGGDNIINIVIPDNVFEE